MKAVFLDYDTMGPGLDLEPLYAVTPDLTIHDSTAANEIAERIADADIVFTNKINLTESLLASASRLKLVALTATGTDNVDLEQAAKSGIAVANIRDYCTESVVEHVFGTLLMLTRSLAGYRSSVAAGDWQNAGNPVLFSHPLRELSAMTLGIVGFGSLGKGVAAAGKAFGMDVIVSARPGADDVAPGRVEFDRVLATADVISLHCPLNDRTRNLFAADQFSAMKDSAFLINTARGGLVDSRALADALANGDIAGAAVDVLPEEPPVNGDPLLDYDGDNLIVTPHIAWATNEARQNAIDELAANAAAFIAGDSRNRVV
ncbi:MAG: D-2-hydroxyacid dehydrogenase [Woeseiaceae bacterium]|nr:D-2-hydroxyacid dehydrogenase [Woeseiaceae bacterium]